MVVAMVWSVLVNAVGNYDAVDDADDDYGVNWTPVIWATKAFSDGNRVQSGVVFAQQGTMKCAETWKGYC